MKSLLETTENTRDLGGLNTIYGKKTKFHSIFRSDIAYNPSDQDISFLKEIGVTTIIDVRKETESKQKPNGFQSVNGFTYYNFPIENGADIPLTPEDVPVSYMWIAESTESMKNIMKCIANTKMGIMFHCTAGKDRTGVISALLLMLVGVTDKDIVEDYVVTKHYIVNRLTRVHDKLPKLNMDIVTPCEFYMKRFLELFREKYQSPEEYFERLGLSDAEIRAIKCKLL